MRINHRRADVVVAEPFLHRSDVVARFQQMRCEAVARRSLMILHGHDADG